ncbi:hypothetical protein IH979_03115, partial [Patescibacteria group bacterium]|nr:hypothetical protein [Patescibacteria group bacterium]
MRIITDWHVHSKYSRACSKDLTLENNALWCEKKGVNVLGTADFTHPAWFAEIKEKLVEAESGMYKLKSGLHNKMRFMMTTEVSQIYKKHDQTRRIHNIIMAPSIETVEDINVWLESQGFNLKADGRPILGIDSEELYKRLKDIDDRIIMIPAHAWTPWFAIFGSKSGFDRIKDCYQDQTKHIHAVETGISSDPAMNWRLSQLDSYTIVSNSDAHSFWPWRLGREATIFDIKLTYDNLLKAFRTGKGLSSTIETDPNYGKYHVDGHRACGICLSPKESNKLNKICPKCNKPLTIGVLNRIEELADRPPGYKRKNAVDFITVMPLSEILSQVLGRAMSTKTVWLEYNNIVNEFDSEFDVL